MHNTWINPQKSLCRLLAWAPAAAVLCAGWGSALAQQPAAAEAPKVWQTSVTASATLTRGNSDTFLGTLSLDSKGKWEQNEATFSLSGGYGENKVNGVTSQNTEFVQGSGQYNRLFTERFYGGLRLEGKYDGIAGVYYRFTISPVAGYYLVKNSKLSLSVEGGPSLVVEHLQGQSANAYWAARLAERLEYKLTANTKFWESVEYLPKVGRWTENYLLNSEAGIETAMNTHWSLRLVLQDMFASEPASDRQNNDLRLLAGTSYKF